MKFARFIFISCLLWLWATPAAFAAGDTPPAPVLSPLVDPPTAAPVQEPPPPAEEPTVAPVPVASPPPVVSSPAPQPYSSPVSVTQEQGSQPPISVPTPAAAVPPPSGPVTSAPTPPARTGAPAPGPVSSRAQPTAPGPDTDTSSSSITSVDTTTGTTGTGVIDVNAAPTGASAPAQLRCSKHSYPRSGPFLSSPYAGWASINSFLDHDNPDYRLDGVMVLANGLHATASGGQASDVFPSYWSTSLRQYVNYDGHNGYDFGISYQPVLAAGDGTVAYAGWNSASEFSGYGEMVLIDHHNGYTTLYGHLSSLEVHTGDDVSAGEEIGISGSTGHSSGPHLHFSVFHNCQVTDPYGWTGEGSDPLISFDGDHAGYLWLPGHDPLVLNTPPHWPAYPLGLKVVLPPSVKKHHLSLSPRATPPVDRLLLLDLPAPQADANVTPGTALARTESLINQEQSALAPYLDDLQTHGVIESYQAIPAAAAVWVRGLASAAQLESLPGVASLSGVQPQDLRAAQAGLAHSVLIQLGPQQAPSLWPVGFRSALHAWRPVVTAVNGRALVEGFALPGEHVIVSLERDNEVPAAAEATGDPETGGFVAMLHDENGAPFNVLPHDVVQVQTGGRNASVHVSALTLRARAHSISGKARPGATVPLAALGPTGAVVWRSAVSANSRGAFKASLPASLPAGSLAVATVNDAAGDQESASAYVPGMVVDLVEGSVRGWTVGHSPTLEVWRQGRLILSQAVPRTADGTFRLALVQGGHKVSLRPSDVVSIGSRWHRRRMTIPRLSLLFSAGKRRLHVVGPTRSRVALSLDLAGVRSSRMVHLGASGKLDLKTGAPVNVGDGATASISAPSGDSVQTSTRVRGVVVHVGNGRVTGQASSEVGVKVRLFAANGSRLGAAESWPDAASGTFSAIVRDMAGRKVKPKPGMRIEIDDPGGTVAATIPHLDLTVSRSGVASISHADSRILDLILVKGGQQQNPRHIDTGIAGSATVHIAHLKRLDAVILSSSQIDGVTFERKFVISRLLVHCAEVKSPQCSTRTRSRG